MARKQTEPRAILTSSLKAACAPLKQPQVASGLSGILPSATPDRSSGISPAVAAAAPSSSSSCPQAAPRLTTLSILKTILREEGVRGLFR